MIVEPDRYRARFSGVFRGNKWMGMGAADKMLRQSLDYLAYIGRRFIIVWGPPGAGKSQRLQSLDVGNLVIVEMTGLNSAWNAWALSLPRWQVAYYCVMADLPTLERRIMKRKSNPMQGDDSPEYLIGLARKWHERWALTNMLPCDTIEDTSEKEKEYA